MSFRIIHLPETNSTNSWLREHDDADDVVVWTDYQTAGRGQGSNSWESERGQNLTFSILIHPQEVKANEQFRLLMAESLAVCETLQQCLEGITIKWPNDIYWHDCKISGTLIECRLAGATIKDCILGTGINVNQRAFVSDAPNPVSMWQILKHETDREELLHQLLHNFEQQLQQLATVSRRYHERLYRREGFFPYRDAMGSFKAELVGVEDSGHLVLRDDQGRERRYAFKEVTFII